MVEQNEVGDVMLDLPSMRVLSENGNYALLERVRRAGPATPAELGVTADDLVALADVGLVAGPDDERRWRAVGRGLFLDIPTDPEGQAVARRLVGAMLLDGLDAPQRWIEADMPRLDSRWFAAAGRLSVRVQLTPHELDQIQAAFEEILQPYLNRQTDSENDLRSVRILSYFMPSSEQ